MIPVLGGRGDVTSITASSTRYPCLGTGYVGQTTTEAERTHTARVAATYSRLTVTVIANDRGASTVGFRKNGANGNQTVSIGASATGVFQDLTNADSVVDGDEINYVHTTGAGGTTHIATSYAVVARAVRVQTLVHGLARNFAGASTTYAIPLAGDGGNPTTEADAQLTARYSGTWAHLYVYVSANARVTTTTLLSRKNAADGNQTLSIGAGATGVFEDTSNADSVVDGDVLNVRLATGTGTQTLTTQIIKTDFVPQGHAVPLCGGSATGLTQNNSLTRYYAVGSDGTNRTTEANAQNRVEATGTWSHLAVRLTANGLSATSTLSSRLNGAAGNQSAAIGASATGYFEDTTHVDHVVPGSDLNYALVTGATGSSLRITVFASTFVADSGVSAFREVRERSQLARLRRYRPSIPSALALERERDR